MDEKKIRKLFTKSSQTSRNKGWVDEEINFDDQVFSYATLSTFFFYEEGRNTWGGKYNYKNTNSFHYDLDIIKYRIRINAKRGSHFKIYTLPAIALVGNTDSVIITDYFQINSHRASYLESNKCFSSDLIFEMASTITKTDSWGYGSIFTLPTSDLPTFFLPNYAYPIIKGSETSALKSVHRTNIDLSPTFKLLDIINKYTSNV